MPSAALLSSALYRIPTLEDALTKVGQLPSGAGYHALYEKFRNRISELRPVPPNRRTVEDMLLRNSLVKYLTCEGILKLLNLEAVERAIDPFALDLIEENEYYIFQLDRALVRIREGRRVDWRTLELQIAQESGVHSRVVRGLRKDGRTNKPTCKHIADAIYKLFGEQLAVTNERTFGGGTRRGKIVGVIALNSSGLKA